MCFNTLPSKWGNRMHGSVNVLIEHHPTIGDIITNKYLKVMFKIPKQDIYQPLEWNRWMYWIDQWNRMWTVDFLWQQDWWMARTMSVFCSNHALSTKKDDFGRIVEVPCFRTSSFSCHFLPQEHPTCFILFPTFSRLELFLLLVFEVRTRQMTDGVWVKRDNVNVRDIDFQDHLLSIFKVGFARISPNFNPRY